MHIEHANITVGNVATSAAFYRQLFGFRTRWEGLSGSGQRAWHIGTEDLYLSLFEAVQTGRAESDYDRPGFNHLGFVVDNLDEYRKTLQQMGVKTHLEADYDPGRRLYFYDPDGIEIELVEY